MRSSYLGRFALLAFLVLGLMGGVSGLEETWNPSTSLNYDNQPSSITISGTANRESFVKSIYVSPDGQDLQASVTVKDSSGNILAERTKQVNGYFTTFYFTKEDYSDYIDPGESFSILVESSRLQITTGQHSFSGSVFDAGSQVVIYEHELTLSDETNLPPTINSSSLSPDSLLVGESFNASYEASDSDGNVSKVEVEVFDGNSNLLNSSSRIYSSSSVSDTVENIYTPQSEGELNTKFTVTDDAGASTTQWLNRTLTDTAPSVNILSPGNQTFWSYDRTLEVDTSGGDSVPDEELTCTADLDSQQFNSQTVTEGETYTTDFDAGLGQHTVEVTCTDTNGHTNTSTVDFTTKAFEQQNVFSPSTVYETETHSYDTEVKTGAMVNEISFDLFYDGQLVNQTSFNTGSIQTVSTGLENTVGLVSSNNSEKNWSTEYSLNYTKLDGSYAELNTTTSNQTQNVLWSYFLQSSDTLPSNGNYIETEDLKHDVVVHTETKKAQLTGTTTYDRNSETATMEKEVVNTYNTTFRGVIDVGKADGFNSSQFEVSSDVLIEFDGESRTLTTSKDTLEVYKIILTDGTSNLNTAKALEFDVNYEEDGYDAETRLTLDLSVWKNRGELIRRYSFKKDPAETHSFHIYPSWAEYKIRTLPYPEETKFDLIQYWNQDTNKVRRSYFFPTTQSINNQTTTVPLKTINSSEASRINFEVTQSGGSPASNVYCRVDRKFGGGDFETVFMIKTGSEGKAQSFAEVNEIYYSFTCYKNGEVVEVFPSQIMQDPMVLNIGEEDIATTLDYQDNFDASCSHNTTSVSCSYQSQSEKLEQAVLTVDRLEPVQDQQVCSKTSPTATGQITCTGLNTSENDYEYTLTGDYPGLEVVGAAGQTGTPQSYYEEAGLILVLFFTLFTMAATSFNVTLGIGVGTLSMLLTSIPGFWTLTASMRATLIALAIIGGLVINK